MNSKISTNMKIRLLFNVNFVLIGRHIHLFAIACMGVNVICYWVFSMTTVCLFTNLAISYSLQQKIERKDWVAFISQRFADTGKQISDELYLVWLPIKWKTIRIILSKLSQQTWLRTSKECSEAIVNEAFNSLIGQLSLLFTNIIDSLTSRQINFLIAVADGVVNFSSKDIFEALSIGNFSKYQKLEKSDTWKRFDRYIAWQYDRNQDPAFEYWLKNVSESCKIV